MEINEKEKKKLKFIFIFIIFQIIPHSVNPESTNNQHHFVLVHGACHGAWTWYKIVALLGPSGHKVTAIDLASSGTDSKQAHEVQSLSAYFEPLTKYMAHLGPDHRVVLVAHGYGGFAASHVMEKYPEKIRVAVFLSALMPGPTISAATLFEKDEHLHGSFGDSQFEYWDGPHNPPTTIRLGPKFLANKLYYSSSEEELALATMLLRPMYMYTTEDIAKEMVLTGAKYGSVKRVYMEPEGDKVAKPDFVRMTLAQNPPNEVMYIKGADHMVMLSKPYQLSSHLLQIASKY